MLLHGAQESLVCFGRVALLSGYCHSSFKLFFRLDNALMTVPHLSSFSNRVCVVTGGASFIGSHLVELLVRNGAVVKVIDDLSSGKLDNLKVVEGSIEFVEASVRHGSTLSDLLSGAEIVFHLAAIHGGRGFIDAYPERMMENLAIDWTVFSEARAAGVSRVVHASSACAYPTFLQSSSEDRTLLSEDSAGFETPNQSFPDGAYGWSKLMGEYQLKTIAESSEAMSGRSARIFTAYGSRENESHAAVALWAKAALQLDPYPIWGDGSQTRNFTHVSDTVHGLALVALDDRDLPFDSFNVGSSTHYTVNETVEEIFKLRNWHPNEISYELDRPVGVRSRASDNRKILSVFGWEPSVQLAEGLAELGEWYDNERLPNISRDGLQRTLFAR